MPIRSSIRWRDARQPVTYVRTGNEGALIVERDAFERAMADDRVRSD